MNGARWLGWALGTLALVWTAGTLGRRRPVDWSRALLPPARPIPTLPNARRLPFGGGIVAMALPDASNVSALRELGVRRVISEVPPDQSTLVALERAGIEDVPAPIGSTFRHADTIRRAALTHGPIAIHCRHGVDRTGATVAYLLHCMYGVPLSRAFAAVVSPTSTDRENLARILRDYRAPDDATGLYVERALVGAGGPYASEVGLYSAARNGGIGGMKARPGGYENLIRTALDAARECRP